MRSQFLQFIIFASCLYQSVLSEDLRPETFVTKFNFKMVEAGAVTFPILEFGRPARLARISGYFQEEVIQFDRPLLRVLHDVQNQYGSVKTDCSIFVQIAAQLLCMRSPQEDRDFFLLPRGQFSVDITTRLMGLPFAYIEPASSSTRLVLQQTSFSNKGQWVLETATDQYLGLSSRGPITLTAREWMKVTRQDLFLEIDQRLGNRRMEILMSPCPTTLRGLSPKARLDIETRLLHSMRRSKELDLWTIRKPAK